MINKKLILKYKNEFEHWLNGGKLLCKYEANKSIWWITIDDDDAIIWTKSPEDVVIIIDDEFVDIKKTYYANELEKLEYIGAGTNFDEWSDWIKYRDLFDESQLKCGLSKGFINDYPITRPQMFRLKLKRKGH